MCEFSRYKGVTLQSLPQGFKAPTNRNGKSPWGRALTCVTRQAGPQTSLAREVWPFVVLCGAEKPGPCPLPLLPCYTVGACPASARVGTGWLRDSRRVLTGEKKNGGRVIKYRWRALIEYLWYAVPYAKHYSQIYLI